VAGSQTAAEGKGPLPLPRLAKHVLQNDWATQQENAKEYSDAVLGLDSCNEPEAHTDVLNRLQECEPTVDILFAARWPRLRKLVEGDNEEVKMQAKKLLCAWNNEDSLSAWADRNVRSGMSLKALVAEVKDSALKIFDSDVSSVDADQIAQHEETCSKGLACLRSIALTGKHGAKLFEELNSAEFLKHDGIMTRLQRQPKPVGSFADLLFKALKRNASFIEAGRKWRQVQQEISDKAKEQGIGETPKRHREISTSQADGKQSPKKVKRGPA